MLFFIVRAAFRHAGALRQLLRDDTPSRLRHYFPLFYFLMPPLRLIAFAPLLSASALRAHLYLLFMVATPLYMFIVLMLPRRYV